MYVYVVVIKFKNTHRVKSLFKRIFLSIFALINHNFASAWGLKSGGKLWLMRANFRSSAWRSSSCALFLICAATCESIRCFSRCCRRKREESSAGIGIVIGGC